MKPSLPYPTADTPPPPPAERLADALLAEQARLGTRDDEELVNRILTETVTRRAAVRATRHASAPARFTAREWTQLALSVAAVLALAATVLSLFRFGQESGAETYHFRVKLVEAPDAETPEASPPADRPPARPGRAHEGRFSPEIPTVQPTFRVSSLTLQDQEFNLLTHFERSLDGNALRPAREDAFSIAAAEASTEGTVARFRGGVTVTHSDFQLRADRVEVLYGEEGDSRAPRLVAHGVELTHFPSASKAEARRAVFDTANGALTLDGMETLNGRREKAERQAPLTGGETVVFAGEEVRVLAGDAQIHASPPPVTR